MARPAKHPNLVKLGERIRAARQELSWSQEDLADKAEIDRSYIGGVERGERNVSFTTLCKIASALGSNVSRLTKGIPRE
jgi:transcriptional regulator with XRE-family HTH domain